LVVGSSPTGPTTRQQDGQQHAHTQHKQPRRGRGPSQQAAGGGV